MNLTAFVCAAGPAGLQGMCTNIMYIYAVRLLGRIDPTVRGVLLGCVMKVWDIKYGAWAFCDKRQYDLMCRLMHKMPSAADE